ncbi:RNA polymerase subunit sigma-24 [Verrucomicrobia bacterium LW23]|nr:RNA polymerase subunit sigma-24 [Verrucomicrobia bacterium LW23]
METDQPLDIDVDLMRRVAHQDDHAFRLLVERHQNAVYGTILKMLGDPIEAEDIAQQVFIRVYRAAPQYQPSAQFRTWLFTIVRNLVFNEHRRRSRAWFFSIDQQPEEESDAPRFELPDTVTKAADRDIMDREMMDSIDRAIRSLPEQQRIAVILRRYDEFSYEEIAEVMKVSVPSVKSLLFRARETLRVKLSSYLHGDGGEE